MTCRRNQQSGRYESGGTFSGGFVGPFSLYELFKIIGTGIGYFAFCWHPGDAQLHGTYFSMATTFQKVLVQISIFGPIWQARDAIFPRAIESTQRAFLKFAPEPLSVCFFTNSADTPIMAAQLPGCGMGRLREVLGNTSRGMRTPRTVVKNGVGPLVSFPVASKLVNTAAVISIRSPASFRNPVN